jgi:hypothetical protein
MNILVFTSSPIQAPLIQATLPPGALLFECTDMCPFPRDAAEVSCLPVFATNTLINLFYRAVNPVPFLR